MSVPKITIPLFSVSMHKGEFCYCTGMSRYKLTKFIKEHEPQLRRLGYGKYDKILMPNVTQYILRATGLSVDMERLAQCMGQGYMR